MGWSRGEEGLAQRRKDAKDERDGMHVRGIPHQSKSSVLIIENLEELEDYLKRGTQ